MTGHNRIFEHSIVTAALLANLAGCSSSSLSPTVPVVPGPGKSVASFQIDNAACKAYASEEVKGQADAANQQAIGTALLATVLGSGLGAATGGIAGNAAAGAGVGAVAGAGVGGAIGSARNSNDQINVQQQYNNAFSQCMFAKHDQVPGFAPAVVYAPAHGSSDPLVRSIKSELIQLGYLKGRADGNIDARTRDAIANFEQANGLPPDGSPSPQLLAKLLSASSGTPNASASAPHDWVTPADANSSLPPTTACPGTHGPGGGLPGDAPTGSCTSSSGWVTPIK